MGDLHASADEPVTILVAHGSRLASANEAHVDLCRELSERTSRSVRPAFLELAEPSIGAAIDDAAGVGAPIVVLPFFLLPGNHTGRDIPDIVTAARARHPALDLSLARYLGAETALVDVVADVITRGIT